MSGGQEREDVLELLADENTLELSVANCPVEKCADDRICVWTQNVKRLFLTQTR